VGGALLCVLAAAVMLAPVLASHDPLEITAGGGSTLERPTMAHPFGTDALGRDLLARVLWAGRVSLAVGIGVELLVALLGCTVGLVAGYNYIADLFGWSGKPLDNVNDVLLNALKATPETGHADIYVQYGQPIYALDSAGVSHQIQPGLDPNQADFSWRRSSPYSRA
jgi:ABC-type dipeptide/oligopeptide/nickel transport system permease subunit